MAVLENVAQAEDMSGTSVPKQSATTKTASKSTRQKTSPSDRLRMLQALLNDVDEIKGIAVRYTTIFDEGHRVLAIIVYGVDVDDAGNLIYDAGK